jgi:hypothetical protein
MQGIIPQITQSPPTFWTWFYTNAPAGWISAVVALGMLVFVLRSRKRPSVIVVRESFNESLIRIRDFARRGITIKYLDKPIDALGWVSLSVVNEGSDAIREPNFRIVLTERTKVLHFKIKPDRFSDMVSVAENVVTVSLPHLNSFRAHKHRISLLLVVDGDTTITVEGSGEGWSVRHRSDTGIERGVGTFKRTFAVGVIAGLMLALFVVIVHKWSFVSRHPYIGQLIGAGIPILITVFGLSPWSEHIISKYFRKVIRRFADSP